METNYNNTIIFYISRLESIKIFTLPVDKSLYDDLVYVIYDVFVGDKILIPKNTMMRGNWISKNGYLQLQISWVNINDVWISCRARSEIIDNLQEIIDYDSIVPYNYNSAIIRKNTTHTKICYHNVDSTEVRIVLDELIIQ
jgi:hypothetical protein